MKLITRESCIFAVRTFAAALLALYISYYLDLPQPMWALQTVYAVAGPLAGIGRSKAMYRMCGTLCGAIFTVIAFPNLINAPELLVVAIACWIGLCLYLSIIDGTQRSSGFVLAGFTAATIAFLSVNMPQVVFFAALTRVEEIGVGILCVQLMSYLPFNPRAGDALQTKINQWTGDARGWAADLMRFSQDDIVLVDRSRLMVEVTAIEDLHIQARYDTPNFSDIEGWVIRFRREMQTLFAVLVTFEAQLKMLKSENPAALNRLKPVSLAMTHWIESGETAAPQALEELISGLETDASARDLAKAGVIDTLSNLVLHRSTSLDLRAKIASGVKADQQEIPVAHYVDYRQSALYGVIVTTVLILMSAFWIATGWPAGGIAAMLSAVIFCLFSSLEAPGKIGSLLMVMVCLGSLLGWLYNYVIFPSIEGFVPLSFALVLMLLPLGLVMAHPKLAPLSLPIIIAIILINFQNDFSYNIATYLNNVIAMIIGVSAAVFSLNIMRILTLPGATKRLLTENSQSLAEIARNGSITEGAVVDRMAHRASMILQRAPNLRETRGVTVSRILSDCEAGLALQQIKDILPKIYPALQISVQSLQASVADYFSARRGLNIPQSSIRQDIRSLMGEIDRTGNSYDSMRLAGFLKTLDRSLGADTVQEPEYV